MPRVVVTTERGSAAVLFDEQVHAVHLSNEHSARQLMERLGWAITDAELVETKQRPGERRPRTSGPRARSSRLGARRPLHA
jgi:hypothetical protein